MRKNYKRKSVPKNWRESLEKMNYAVVGNTSAVQICRWTKNSLRGGRGCWKEKFYGISSAGCCQMTPSVMWCENKCLHCWRPIEMNLGTNLPSIDDPKKILDQIVEQRKKLLMGFKGRKKMLEKIDKPNNLSRAIYLRENGKCDQKSPAVENFSTEQKKLLMGFNGRKGIEENKFEEALEPKLYTMSLSGEPTLYPKLGEMFKEIRRRGAVSFLVTNGQNPSAIEKLKQDELPTQITVSLNAPDKKLFDLWHNSCKQNAWEEFQKTLEVIKTLKGKVRRVIRLTLVAVGKSGKLQNLTNMSDENLKEYLELIHKAEPDFIHVKGFKSVGYARNRLGYDKQPWFSQVKTFSEKLQKELPDYEIGGEDERCCVVMLKKKGIEMKIKKI